MRTAAAAATSRTPAPAPSEARICPLHAALGRSKSCPGPRCPFWEEGGAVVPAGCALQRLALDLERRPQLAGALLGVLDKLERSPSREDKEEAYALFHRLVPDAREDEGDRNAQHMLDR